MFQIFLSPFCAAIPEIIGVKVHHRQSHNFFDTKYVGIIFIILHYLFDLKLELITLHYSIAARLRDFLWRLE